MEKFDIGKFLAESGVKLDTEIRVSGVHDPLYHTHWFGGKSWQGLIEKVQTVTHWIPTLEDE